MLVNAKFINQLDPQTVWFDHIGPEYRLDEPPAAPVPKSRTKRLRRMSRQNFVERAVHNVIELFDKKRRSA